MVELGPYTKPLHLADLPRELRKPLNGFRDLDRGSDVCFQCTKRDDGRRGLCKMHLTQLIKQYETDADKMRKTFRTRLDEHRDAADEELHLQGEDMHSRFAEEMQANNSEHNWQVAALRSELQAAEQASFEASHQFAAAGNAAVLQRAAAHGYHEEALELNSTWNIYATDLAADFLAARRSSEKSAAEVHRLNAVWKVDLLSDLLSSVIGKHIEISHDIDSGEIKQLFTDASETLAEERRQAAQDARSARQEAMMARQLQSSEEDVACLRQSLAQARREATAAVEDAKCAEAFAQALRDPGQQAKEFSGIETHVCVVSGSPRQVAVASPRGVPHNALSGNLHGMRLSPSGGNGAASPAVPGQISCLPTGLAGATSVHVAVGVAVSSVELRPPRLR